MSSAATAARATHVLLVCESLRVTGGVERFVCQLGNELVARGLTVTIGNVDAERAAVVYPLDPRVRRRRRRGDAAARQTARGHRPGAGAAARALARRPCPRPRRRCDARPMSSSSTASSPPARCWRCGRAGPRRSICCDHNHFDARSRLWRRLRARFYPRVAAVVSLTEADAPRFSRA